MNRMNDYSAATISAVAIAILGVLIALGAFAIESPKIGATSTVVVLHFAINTIVVLFALGFAVYRHPYSLHLFHLIGLLIFVCVGGLYQYLSGAFPIAGPTLTLRGEIPIANIAVTLWVVAYLAGYLVRSMMSDRVKPGAFARIFEKPVGIASIYFSLVVGLFALVYLASLGLVGAFTRAAAYDALSVSSSGPIFLINRIFVRALPLLAVAATALAVRRGRMSLGIGLLVPMFIVEIIGVAITNSPFAAARYWFVAVAVGLSAPHLLARRRTGVLLLVCAIVGFSVLPSMGTARHAETVAEIVEDHLRLDSPFEYLATSGDVDAFGMMSLAVKWTDINGHRWGMQILGAALFWVPRTLWPDKPIGTGAMVTDELGFDFTNYSVPIMTEPLVDFGLIGVLIFAVIFGWILSSVDNSYWASFDPTTSPTGFRRIDIIYPFWAGLMLFMTRGDLLSSFGYTVGISFAMFPFFLVPARIRARVARTASQPT